MAVSPTLQQRLAQAVAAYHQLLTGTLPSEVMVDSGYLVRYQHVTPANLRAYILDLEAEIAGKRLGGAIGIRFG